MKNDKTLVNNKIRSQRVLVISHEGKRLGEFLVRDAIEIAKDEGLDLVQVGSGVTPTCKVMDYGKFLYNQKKKKQKEKRSSSTVKVKEIRLRPNTELNDMLTLMTKAKSFLEKGNKVKVTVKTRGRGMSHLDLLEKMCYRMYSMEHPEEWKLENISVIELKPARSGNNQFSMLLMPKTK